jgi:hypothetical protein
MSFAKETQELLKAAGWYPGRNVSGQYSLPIDGYPSLIINFLNEYGNLTISGKKHSFSDVVEKIEINPKHGEGEYEEEESDYSYYSSLIKRKLFPMGFFLPDHYNICCDAEGRVYMIGEYGYCRGKTLYEGFDNILLGNWAKFFKLDEDTGQWWNRDGEYVPLP